MEEKEIGRLEGIMEQINQRLNHMETAIIELRKEMSEQIGGIRNEISSNFKWTIGVIITMWVTVILTILFKG